MSRRDAGLLVVLLGAGAWLRAPLLGEGFWRDEASTYYDVAAKGLADTLAMIVRIELAPPAYFLVEKLWAHAAGFGPVALKLPSFIYSLGLIVAMYALGRALGSSAIGLAGAAFACVSQPAIDLSAEARVYEFAGLAAAATLIAYAHSFRAARPRTALLWFAACGIVLAYANYAGSIFLALLCAATLYLCWIRRDAARLRAFVFAFVAIGVAYAPWLPTMLAHARIGAPFQERTRFDTFFDIVNKDFGHLLPFASRHGQLGMAFALGAIVWIVVALRRKRTTAPRLPGVVAALAFCTVGGVCIAALLSLREPRYVFVFAPGAWAWLAWLAARFGGWLARAARAQQVAAGIAAAALVVLFIPSERQARDEGPVVSSGIRDLAPAALALARTHRTLFVAIPDYLAPTFGYYVSRIDGTPVYGFARWNDPQIFVTSAYRDVWMDPAAAGVVEAHIASMMRTRFERLCLLRDTILIDRAQMPYTRGDAVIAWIGAHYHRISSAFFPGRAENVQMEVFTR